jgi:threonine dehydrogenase-like Zn-dependent dehydrogenase
MKIQFQANEYKSDDSFELSNYEFLGDESSGWEILRNGKSYLRLDSGYRLLKTHYCGVCSTDLDRRFLPFPLPQVIGHELVAEDLEDGKVYAVEINDTDVARGSQNPDIFCKSGIPTHSPTRLVLGIDRLPGGFGPYILAPKNAMVSIGKLNEKTAVLTEPFAAGLQAVIASPPKNGMNVAVLGPRRLGSLLIAALSGYRKSEGLHFSITAIARHDHLYQLTKNLGADHFVNTKITPISELHQKFDIVYDTTSQPDGFLQAMDFSSQEVHLKSTNGQTVCGIKKMTELVVDEISILPFTKNNLHFHWSIDSWKNEKVYVSPSLKGKLDLGGLQEYSPDPSEILSLWKTPEFQNRLPRFDIAIASSEEEIDFILRPFADSEESLLRPRGAILYKGDSTTNPFFQFLQRGGRLRSSRCGDFHLAIQILEENPELAHNLAEFMITHELDSTNMNKAFQIARDSSSVKVIIKHI